MQVSQKLSREVGILLFRDFSMHALANTVEPLRAANTLAGRSLYRWRYLGMIQGQVVSSSGLPVWADCALRDHAGGSILFIVSSYGNEQLRTPKILRSIAAAATRFETMAGIDTGSDLMAAAGLLSGHRATIHWDELARFAETYPDIDVSDARTVHDGKRLSCGGAMTAFDLAIDLIGKHHGAMLRLEVASLFMHGERATTDPAPQIADRVVLAAVALMRRHIEYPLSVPDIAKRLSTPLRRLETLCRINTNRSPRALYRRIRLQEAQRFVRNTSLPIAEIATRCGYEDASAMTRAYKAEFDTTPRATRASLTSHRD
jgi:AraC family carnitine catabolism transcriptional activator